MGTRYLFTCPSCGYSAEVSGGNDAGVSCAQTTISCETCRELRDVLISTDPSVVRQDESGHPLKPDWEPPELKCPASGDHKIKWWSHPGLCPRCGDILEKHEDKFVLWD
jgi:hypothetical protein